MEKDKTRWFLIIDYYWLLLCRARARCPLPPSSSPPGGPKDRSILKSIQKHPASRSILKSSSKGSRVAKWPQIERTEAFYTVNEPLNHGLSDPGFEGVMVGDASERPEASSSLLKHPRFLGQLGGGKWGVNIYKPISTYINLYKPP